MLESKLLEIITREITLLNEELDYDHLRDVSSATPIYGAEDSLDSLSLINLIMAVERAVNSEFDKKVRLADPQAMSAEPSPYRDVASFLAFTRQKLL